MEAEAGIEPTNESFADFYLTTWLPRHKSEGISPLASLF